MTKMELQINRKSFFIKWCQRKHNPMWKKIKLGSQVQTNLKYIRDFNEKCEITPGAENKGDYL